MSSGAGAASCSRGQRSGLALLAIAAAAASAIPVVRSTWWINPDNYAYLAWGEQVRNGVQLTLGNALTTPHPLPIIVGAAISGLMAPIALWTAIAAVATATIVVAAAIAAGRRQGIAAATIAGAFAVASDGIGESLTLRSVDLISTAAIAAAIAVPRQRVWLRVVLIAIAGLIRPEAWPVAATIAVADSAGPLRRRVAAGVAAGALAPVVWMVFDTIVAHDPLLAIHRTDALAGIARRLTPVGDAPRVMAHILLVAGGSVACVAGAIGVLIAIARFVRRVPGVDLLPSAVIVLVPLVTLLEVARGYPLRMRYVLPVAPALAIEAACVLVLASRALVGRLPALAVVVRLGFVVLALTTLTLAATRKPDDRTKSLPLVEDGARLLASSDCRRIAVVGQRLRDVKDVPPLALAASTPLERLTFVAPGGTIGEVDAVLVPRDGVSLDDARFREIRRDGTWHLLVDETKGCGR